MREIKWYITDDLPSFLNYSQSGGQSWIVHVINTMHVKHIDAYMFVSVFSF